jgi:hypothetical protein
MKKNTSIFMLLSKTIILAEVIALMVLNFGPFFDNLKFPEKVSANASTIWTKYDSNPVVNNTQASYPRIIKELSDLNWGIQVPDSEVFSPAYTSLALDSSNRPHISYYDGYEKNLKYTYYDGSNWQISTVDSEGDVGAYTSLALDSSNRPHISYYDTSNGNLKYAYYDGSTWQISTIDFEGVVGRYTSLALDSSNRPHVAYTNGNNNTIKYAYYDGSTWQISIVESSVGTYPSLALDSSNRPHIAYTNVNNNILKYAYYNGSTWQISIVESSIGAYPSLALDSSNRPHIAYINNSNQTLKYAYFDDSTWQISAIDAALMVSKRSVSLALDSSNRPHISYLDYSNLFLKYAYYNGSDWQVSTLDSSGYGGLYNSIKLDEYDNVFISYCASKLQFIASNLPYKMWVEDNTNVIRNAYSSDGIIWTPLQNAKLGGGANDLSAHELSIIKDGSIYKMWSNELTGTKYRTSNDGINWSSSAISITYDVTKAWDGDRIAPYVFKDDSTYKMYYNASEGNGKYYIAYAYSSDGLSWTEPQNLGQVQDASGSTNNNLVLKQGDSSAWDGYQSGESLYQMSVLKNTDSTYEMFYGGNTNGSTWKIGYATSADGISWTKSGSNPVLSNGGSGEWDDMGVLYPTIIEDNLTYKMWYTNNWSGKVGYATATVEVITPQTASVTIPATGTYYKSSSIPATFSGSVADGDGGTGLNVNSTTFYIQRTSDNHYWDGTDWDATEAQWLATTHSATADSSEVTWTSSSTLPSWVSGLTYKSAAKATNKASQTYTGTEVTYYYDSVSPTTASVTTPATGTYYKSSSIPATFSGSVADDSSGLGLAANSTTFYIQRTSDNYYWTGTEWSATQTWLSSTHDATTDGTSKTWTDSATLPTWATGITYKSAVKAIDRAGNTYTGTEITYYYDSVSPTTASVITPTDSSTYSQSSIPATFSGSVSDNSNGFGLNADSTVFYIKRGSDNNYWNGTDWTATQTWLTTTHSATTSDTTATWQDSVSLPSWADGTYYSKVKATDKSGNTYEGSELNFIYNSAITLTATVTDPINITFYKSANIPTSFQGKAADSIGGTGLDANSTTFYIKRGADNHYWNGTDWDSATAQWLSTTHDETDDNTEITWISDTTLPTWSSGETYSSKAKATDKESQTFEGSEVIYYYDSVVPATASVTAPSNSGIYGPTTMADIFSGSVADDTNGLGLNANSAVFYLQNGSSNYWTGSDWSATQTWLATTHLATSDGSASSWQDNIVLPSWSNGSYNVKVKISDKANNSYEGSSISFTYSDVMPATATVSLPVNSTYYRESNMPSTFDGSVADGTGGPGVNANSATFYIKRGADNHYWNGTDWDSATTQWLSTTHNATSDNSVVVWTSSATLPTWENGETYSSAVKATNKAGNNYTGTVVTYYYDTEAPVSSLTFSREYYSSTNWPGSISGTASDSFSGVVQVAIEIKRNSDNKYWDGDSWEGSSAWINATGTNTWSYTFGSDNLTSDVNYTIYTRATDDAGNIQSSFGSASFTYDNTAPSSVIVYDGIIVGTETSEVESLTTLSANWTASIDSGSGIDHYEYAIGTTQGGVDVVTWTNNDTSRSVTKSGLTLSVDQTYYLTVKVVNGAGTVGVAGDSSGQTVVDLTPPVVTLVTKPNDPTNNNTSTFVGTSVDAMTSITKVEYKIDSGSWVTAGTNYGNKSADWNFSVSTLSDGSHTVYIRSIDSKENTSDPISYAFIVDTTLPTAPLITSMNNNDVISTQTPTFTGTAEANSTVLITIHSTARDYTVAANANGNWSFTVPDSDKLENGSHTFVAKARDAAGNTSAETSLSFTVSTTSTITELAKTGPDLYPVIIIGLVLLGIFVYIYRRRQIYY